MWTKGDRVMHRDNPALGVGRVVALEGRTLVVEFPEAATTLRFGAATDALAEVGAEGVPAFDDAPVERLARGDVGSLEAFGVRLDALHLERRRTEDPLGSFLGGRIRLFPHQLDVALKATRQDPVRWLLADEVGLGKTVEACLIANHLLRTRRTERTLVVAPETLTVQWLGELWRKYHQVFVLIDEARLADVEKDFGPGFNPFDVHRRAVIGLDTLIARPKLTEQAVAAGIDLLIVDEAHHLRRPPGHPGDPAYRAIAPIAALGRHVLLLTATPLEDDAHGFFRLLQLLRPDELPEGENFDDRLARRVPLPPCASSTRRADIGGLPPRIAAPVDLPGDPSWRTLAQLEEAIRGRPAPHAVARRENARLLRAALSSGVSLLEKAPKDDAELRALAREWSAGDPRLDWLARAAARWRDEGGKTLVFAAERVTVEHLRSELSRRVQLRTGVFHEDLSPGQRDIEVAQFRLPSGPSLLLATECGGEGRNFEFCDRLVLFDLPWGPMAVEQRIGRLDRIGRKRPVEIVYVRPPAGLGRAIAGLYESIGLFREPLGGIARELARLERAIEDAAAGNDPVDDTTFAGAAREAASARDRVADAAYHALYDDPFVPARGAEILARIPGDLDELTEEVVLGMCGQLGFRYEEHRGGRVHAIDFGATAKVDSLPGVAGGASFLGTFDREEAVADESLDFYASGHPLVEGLLAEIDDGPVGRTALLLVDRKGESGLGLLALYRTPTGFEAVCVDASGRPRPDWAQALAERPLRSRRARAEALTSQPDWEEGIRRMAAALPRPDPAAVAAVIVGTP
ncbi:MAG TPA: SNF2-related protein [Candidatus Polarisedimenticolaceae bacterium]|nr:SNF2-related protein [Candidatus Polarisedimenticolaceae bacterium]